MASPPSWLTTSWILAQFAATRGRAQTAYRAFVSEQAPDRPWDQLRNQIYLGSEAFVNALPLSDGARPEVPRTQRHRQRPTLASLLPSRQPTAQTIATAYREHGYRLREIAEYCGVHYATVSRRLHAAETARARITEPDA
jgi:DNA-directed RNA polymerase specialized sigma24 family protein